MIAAAFHVAHRLFGLSFEEAEGLALYHPDVRVWQVTRGGKDVGVFLGDYFARASKRSGAWMSGLRDQQKLTGDVRPIIVNVMNFAKAPKGQPTLLSFDDVRTLFHEFGHALHGLLSDVTYPLISGTNVARDFVELPSQLYEHWAEQPEVLREFAVHAETGEPMPEALLDKLIAARRFNQGFRHGRVRVLGAGRSRAAPAAVGRRCRRARLREGGAGEDRHAAGDRHAPPHAALRPHLLGRRLCLRLLQLPCGPRCSTADAFEAFAETGDIFDPGTAARLHDNIYSAGYRRDPGEAYVGFRGRLPTSAALLRKRGLDGRT